MNSVAYHLPNHEKGQISFQDSDGERYDLGRAQN